MTNAEKYLKDGVTIKEFAVEITKQISKWDELSYYSNNIENDIIDFLSTEAKPTLTEDERVILKNMDTKNYTHLYRTDNLIFLKNKKEHLYWIPFSNNFQFIKERRRIRDKGVTR